MDLMVYWNLYELPAANQFNPEFSYLDRKLGVHELLRLTVRLLHYHIKNVLHVIVTVNSRRLTC